MECRVYRPVDRDVVQIWLFEDRGTTRHVYVKQDRDTWEIVAVPEMTTMPVSLELRPEMFRALIAAGMDFEPPSAAVSKHLDDAIMVRDRLLTLVEQS